MINDLKEQLKNFVAAGAPRPGSEKGSFIVAAIFFMFVFMMIAAFAVDVSSYFNKRSKLQNMANTTALAGGQAFRQYTDHPEETLAIKSIVKHIKQRQGTEKLEQYYHKETLQNYVESSENSTRDNIEIRHMETNCGIPGAGTYVNWVTATDTEPIPEDCWGSNTNDFYLVGVVLYDHFEPLFLPSASFGEQLTGMSASAVAVVEPQDNRKKNNAIDCGLIVGKSDTATGIDINGNNWDMTGGDMCTNAPINFAKGKDRPFPIYQYKNSECHNEGSSCSDLTTFGEVKGHPDFSQTDATTYDVNLGNSDSWDQGSCSSGEVEMENSSGNVVEWTDGTPVCVDDSSGTYTFNEQNKEQMQNPDGSPVSIYADDEVAFNSTDGSGIRGGLYAEGDITIKGNDHNFIGDPDTKGGLSLYTEGTLKVKKNSNTFEGIVGAEEDMIFTSSGGGQGSISGQVIVGDEFQDNSNSNAAVDITYNEEKFDQGVLTGGDWQFIQDTIEEPLYSNVEVSLAE